MAELVLDKDNDEGFGCNLCFEIYGENLRPHTLPCGHSFCTGCIINLLKNGTCPCPKCKREHQASSESDFPINYDLEALMLDSRLAKVEKMTKSQTRDIGNRIETFIADQKNNSLALIQETDDLESQFKGYEDYLNNLTKEHKQCLKEIHDVAQRHEAMVKMIDGEHKVLEGLTKELDRRRKVFQPKVENLEKAANTKTALEAISALEGSSSSLEELNKSCRQRLPNGYIIITSKKMLIEVKSALSLIESESAEISSEVPNLTLSKFTLQEKIGVFDGQGTMTLRRLQKMSEVTENILKEGLVYAIQTQEGCVRSAKLSLEEDKLYLHYLKDGEPPSNAHTIKHCVLMGNLYKYSTVVFMDLAWEGTAKGRVHIRLTPLTPYAKQFQALCTGELGPTYARSKFFSVISKNSTVNEQVAAGDYESNDGKGGASIITGLEEDEGQYTRLWLPGSVSFYKDIGHRNSASFNITTGNGTPSSTKNNIFGQVEDGLDIVQQAAKVNQIKDVEIVDCGVIVPL